MAAQYIPPDGDAVALELGKPYTPPVGGKVSLNIGYVYDPPPGYKVSLSFGAAGYAPPIGNAVPLEFIRDADGGSETQYLFPPGTLSEEPPAPVVWRKRQDMRAWGADAALLGVPVVRNLYDRIAPAGLQALTVGAVQVVLKDQGIVPRAFDAVVFGASDIANWNKDVRVGGILPPVVPGATIWLRTRYVGGKGVDTSGFGTQRISHEIQRLGIPGITAPSLGAPWLSYRVRRLEPAGHFYDGVGRPQFGHARTLLPAGWDSAAFGERIIPEIQGLYPSGFAEQWGAAKANNWLSFVGPLGFQTTVQEQYRFGSGTAWLQTQQIIQDYDPQSGLSPPSFGGWQSVENRNRVIGAIGVVPPKFGTTYLENNARLLAPWAIAAPFAEEVDKRHLVAHSTRALPLLGIEPPPMSQWAALHNAAVQVLPKGAQASAWGLATVANNRRTLSRIGDIESPPLGTAFIAQAIRTISLHEFYAIAPPDVPLPVAKLYTRYIEPQGGDFLRLGGADLSIHRNIIAPKWAARDYFGVADLKNRTPELHTFGADANVYGSTAVRLQWRPLHAYGADAALFGGAIIGDRTQRISVAGMDVARIGDKLEVRRLGAPPYSEQNIVVDKIFSNEGGIGHPVINQNVLRLTGIASQKFGVASVRFMGARVDAGIRQDSYGTPSVELWVRTLGVAEWRSDQVPQPSKPRLSPYTIYAVREAPDQAKDNHDPAILHYVGETNEYPPGERFGKAGISLFSRTLQQRNPFDLAGYGTPRLMLGQQFLGVKGIQAYRMGWALVGAGEQWVRQYGGIDAMDLGRPSIGYGPPRGPLVVTPVGVEPEKISDTHWASAKVRELAPKGLEAGAMGRSVGNDNPYQWQSLNVGERRPTVPDGWVAQVFGQAWISLRIRGVEAQGFDAFVCEHDPKYFRERLRVVNGWSPQIPQQPLAPHGLEALSSGVPNIRPAVQHIRPDGNSEQYRKGAF